MIFLCSGCQSSFSIGYIFYYWEYYSHPRDYKNYYWNINDHSGYSPHDLYITKKYECLKDEMLNNTLYCLNYHQYQTSITKMLAYRDTKIAKSTKVLGRWIDYQLHYDIRAGSKLTNAHLLALILYCDWTDLCSIFSSTFRKTKSYQTIKQIKLKNSEYANWSRLLREAVQYFGSYGWDYEENEKYNKTFRNVKGPFYCGMSRIMVIPEWNIRLCSPTSTSKQIEVATRFGGDDGMIIQINNNGYYASWNARCFNCSWLRYAIVLSLIDYEY